MERDAQAPIGVFDSGVGGLTVIRELEMQLPEESYIYFGDTAHVPYGDRPSEELKKFALQIGTYLQGLGCKMLIIACNTSSALSYKMLRETLEIPVIGVIEPVVDKCIGMDPEKKVAVIATQATVNSGVYQKTFQKLHPPRTVKALACPAFVPLVESGQTQGPEVEEAVRSYLSPLKELAIDTLVMGCTHYPYLSEAFKAFFGLEVELLDPAQETIAQAGAMLRRLDMKATPGRQGSRRYLCSGPPEQFKEAAKIFSLHPIEKVEQVKFQEMKEGSF